MLSIFKTVFTFATGVIGLIKDKASFSEIILKVLSQAEVIVDGITNFVGGDAKTQIDEALLGLDEFTGTDEGAIDAIKSLPADKEEELFDHMKEMFRILAYNKKQIDGYYIE